MNHLDKVLSERRNVLEATVGAQNFPIDAPPKAERIQRVMDFDKTNPESIANAFCFFCKTYLAEYFTLDFAPFHTTLIHAAANREKHFNLFAAPPEHGKTILFVAWKLWVGITGFRHKYAQISETADIATSNLDLVRLEFRENERILADFGYLLIDGQDTSGDFAVRNFKGEGKYAYTGYRAFGRRNSLKGWTFYQYRIDAVELDDFEPTEKGEDPKQIQKRLIWLYSEVMGRVVKEGALVWIHNNAKAGSLADQIHAKKIVRKNLFAKKFPAIIDGKPLWAARYSLEDLRESQASVGSSVWAGDWMQEPVTEGAVFQVKHIGTYTELPPDIRIVGRADPSLSDTGDFKAIVLLGFSPTTRKFYLVDAFCKQGSINMFIDALYLLYERWRFRSLMNIQVDNNFRQDLIYAPHFTRKEEEKGYRVPVSGFTSKMDKKVRIARLQSPIELGLFLFPEGYEQNPDMAELKDQLIAFPSGHDDGPEMLAECYMALEPQSRRRKNSLKDSIIRIKSSLYE